MRKQCDLRRVYAQAIKHSLFLYNRNVGRNSARNAKIVVIKKFFKKFFRRIFTTKKHSKEQKILRGNNGRHFVKTLDAMRFSGC